MQTYFDNSNSFSAYSEPANTATAAATWSPVTVHDESVSVSISGGEMRTKVSGAEATTISTLPKDVLTIGGVTATRQSFINAGVLSEDGQPSGPSQEAQESAESIAQHRPQESPNALSAEAVEALNYTMEDIPDQSLVNVTTMGINAALADGDISGLVNEVTAITGEDPHYAQERFEQAQAIFQKQADRALTAVGVNDLEAFYGFAKTHHKAALNAAVQRQVFGSDLDGYVPIVKAWKFRQTISR